MNYSLVLSVILLSFISIGCKEELKYKYQDKAKVTDCPFEDAPLMQEALYSFENDISAFFNHDEYTPGSPIYFQYGYANFIYTGATGDANFKEMASPHTLQLLEKLKQHPELWNMQGSASNLNYENDYVTCLISNIQNAEMKQKIETLKSVNYLSPITMADIYRINVIDAASDKNFAMFIALETYYQQLLKVDLSASTGNE